jgi:hypothetical protein
MPLDKLKAPSLSKGRANPEPFDNVQGSVLSNTEGLSLSALGHDVEGLRNFHYLLLLFLTRHLPARRQEERGWDFGLDNR